MFFLSPNYEFFSFPILVAASFNPIDSYIWFELYGSPSEQDVDLIGSVSTYLWFWILVTK